MRMKESLSRAGTEELSGQSGVVAVTVALLLVVVLSFGALALDIGSLFVVKNELQNGADAGALAAARVLYTPDGTSVNADANAIGVAAAQANTAQNTGVEVNADVANNGGDVQRGHWSWANRTFTPNASLLPVNLVGVTTGALDADPDFINAVRVKVRRETTPASSFLSRVMGFTDFPMSAESIAYVGFAGTLLAGTADAPIAMCEQSLRNADGSYSCSTGRMINSGGGATHNTGGWTNFTQQPCATANPPSIDPYVNPGCSASAAPELELGIGMGTTGGEVQTVFDDFFTCWLSSADSDADGRPDTVTNMTLPVIDCPGNNVGNCSTLVGAVNVNMVWMIRQAKKNDNGWIPLEMSGPNITDWACSEGTDASVLTDAQFASCWSEFATHFDLQNYQGTSVGTFKLSELNKTMFFLPDCQVHVPTGGTGGTNFGILAALPVLVQ